MTIIRGVWGAVDDVAAAWQNDIEDIRGELWDLYRRQGVVRGLVMTADAGSLSVTFTAGSAIVEERGTDITGNARAYHVAFYDSFQVTFGAPSAAVRNDALVVAWADPQYGSLGASVSSPGGPQVVVVPGVSGSSTPRTDAQINTAIGPGGWFRFADVIINNGDTQIAPANVTRTGQTVYESARVERNAAQSIPASTTTAIAWDTILSNGGGMVPTVANGIVVAGGKYAVSGSVALDHVGSDLLFVQVLVNGIGTKAVYRGGFSSSAFNPTLITWNAGDLDLVANDVVSVSVFHNRASAVNTYVAISSYYTDLMVRKVPSL